MPSINKEASEAVSDIAHIKRLQATADISDMLETRQNQPIEDLNAAADQSALEQAAAIAIMHLKDAISLIEQGKNDDALGKLYRAVQSKIFSNENAGGKVYTVRYSPNISEEAYGIIKEYCPLDEVSGEDDSDIFSMNLISSYFLEEHGEMFGELSEEDVNVLFSIKEDYIEI